MFGPDDNTSTAIMPTMSTPLVSGGWFWNGNAGANVPACTISSDFLNGIVAEFQNLLAVAGITFNKSDLSQLKKAIFAVGTPATAGAAGVQGMTMSDANFFYVCIATNSWKRVPISSGW
jgi:hypothetical protein